MLIRKQGRRARRSGFTLLELLLVVAIIVALASIVAMNLGGAQDRANIGLAKAQVTNFEKMVSQYKIDNNSYPDTLEQLLQPPPNSNQGTPAYAKDIPKDPWGQAYQYSKTGTHNSRTGEPDIWSNGPDKQSGTADDVGNWPKGS